MNQEDYINLYQRFLSGKATPQEIELLSRHEDEFDINDFDNDEHIANQETIQKRIYQQIEHKIKIRKPKKHISRLWWSVAASMFLLSGIGLYLLSQLTGKEKNKPEHFAHAQKPIVPGANKAILILGNGDLIDLDQTQNGHIAQTGSMVITKLKNGQLAYEKANPSRGSGKEISFNTIVTPRGGQYQVTLPDGTSVWLNSASSLRYPTLFTGTERHVELNGEAYFEVAKNKNMPFTVEAGEVNVRVLGTHFNISAYNDEPSSKTTLLEGSVRLTKDHKQLTILPGQQAVSEYRSRELFTKTVNVEDVVDWKNGYFSFRKESLASAMRKIARWYDLEVIYEGKISNKLLGGSVLRTGSITEVIKMLELTEIAKFKIEGRRIIVKSN